jgi:hypothetical protein
MKKLTLSLIVLLVSVSLFAATTADVTITGQVAGRLSISAASTAVTLSGFENSLGSEATFTVTTITENSNQKTGYTVTVESARGWNLVYFASTYDTDFQIPYKLVYGTTTFEPNGTDPVELTDTTTRTTGAGVEKTFDIKATVPDDVPAGDYRDVLTFTIAAK